MELLKLVLIALAVIFIFLIFKTGTWRRLPIISSIFSIALFIGAVALALFLGSVLIFVILGIIAVFLVMFILFRIFGKASFFRISKGNFKISAEEIKKSNKKPKVKVLK